MQKIAIISDIHGNIKALEAVLKEIDSKQIEKIICLGDLTGGGPYSEEVMQKIMDINDRLIIVRGNRERYIIEGMPELIHDEKVQVTKEQRDRFEWIKNSLSKESIEYIHRLPREIAYEAEGKKIYIAHYPMKQDGNFRTHIKEANIEENEIMFSGIDADIYLYGHTHKEIYNSKNNKLYINPGALGCPEKTDLAPYGILTIDKEKVEYEQLYVKYNVKEVIEYMKELKYPGYLGTLKLFYGVEE